MSPLPAGAVQVTGWLADELAVSRQNRLLGQSLPDLVEPFRDRPEDRFWRCEFWGKWYTSVALACRYSADAEITALSERAVRELFATQTPDGYIGTYQKKAELAQWDVWGRKYVLLGLLAHHDLTGDPAVLAATVRAADYTIGQIGPGRADIARIGNWSGLAAGSILEPMVLLYRKTGYERPLFSAQKPDGSWWCHYNPLAGPRAPAPEQCKAHVNCCVASAPRFRRRARSARARPRPAVRRPPATAAVGELAADSAGFIPGCERLHTGSSAGGPRLLLAVPFRTENGGQTKLRFCDYASAGRTWAEDSAFRVWIPPPADLSRLLTEIAFTPDRH